MKSLSCLVMMIVGVLQGFSLDGGAAACAAQARVAPLNAEEKADLAYMREEEKLARDVYLAMAAKWAVPTFSNIARSEQTHMNSIATLLARYGVADPVAGLPAGQFANEKFQTLYAELIAKGNQSIESALAVGAAIEELDIIDLRDCIAVARHADIIRVYQNLESGSGNHLRAFVGQLAARGVTYQPQYLTPEQYKKIVNR
jgi:hypothetical protein